MNKRFFSALIALCLWYSVGIAQGIEITPPLTSIVSSDKEEVEQQVSALVGMLLANDADNIQLSNDKEMLSTIFSIVTNTPVEIPGNSINLKPCISLIDDDTIDNQIPSSLGGSSPTAKTGGYFSVLLPMTLSLKSKHNKPVPVGLACEGHRVGLTSFKEFNDDYNKTLNINGQAVKWIAENMGWDILNHSMTAQLPEGHTFVVNSIHSDLADVIRINGAYHGTLSFHNTIVLEQSTGKWYEVNSDKTAWVERTPTKKWAMPFYQDYNTKEWYFNRDFDFDYSWGEWYKRAEECGLPVRRMIVHNGSTSSLFMANAGRKYAYCSVRTSGIYNNSPIPATVSRTSTAPGTGVAQGYNVWHDKWVQSKLDIIDNCIKNKSWVVFMSHFNDQSYHRNYYLQNKDYPVAEEGQPALRGKDDNYPEEWIIPLKNDEIMDIIGDNVHDYINHPPSRLGISTWSEWHPAPGTQLAAVYYIWDYAMSRGIDIVTPWNGWQTHGNILNLGVDRNGQSYTYDSAVDQTPYNDEEKSYLTVGADMSIRYYNSKNICYDTYVDALAKQGYEMSSEVAKAVKRFVDTLTDNGLMEYIQTIYPFIGDSNNGNAAKVPLIGAVLFDFPDNFDGLSYDSNKMINGITKIPSISNLKLSDVQPDGDFVGAAYSINKSATISSTYLDKIMNFSNKYQLRLQNNKFAIYSYLSTEKYGNLTANDNLSNKDAAGSIYMLGAFSKGKYLRYAEKDGKTSSASGEIGTSPQMSEEDLQASLSSSTYPVANLVTSITFLKKMMTKEQASLYMTALKTLMADLGRTVPAGSTAVDSIVVDKNSTIYGIFNLNGQRLLSPRKGVNIINGKKVIVK